MANITSIDTSKMNILLDGETTVYDVYCIKPEIFTVMFYSNEKYHTIEIKAPKSGLDYSRTNTNKISKVRNCSLNYIQIGNQLIVTFD